jgi:hypothetical protein
MLAAAAHHPGPLPLRFVLRYLARQRRRESPHLSLGKVKENSHRLCRARRAGAAVDGRS